MTAIEADIRSTSVSERQTTPRWWWIVPVLLLAAWLGARGLDADMIWWDEFLSIQTVGGAHYGPRTPADVWNEIAAHNPWQTPGYFLLLNVWGGAVGWSAFALRALSLFAGLLATAVVYALGKAAVSARVGLGAAVALGLSAFFIHYLHELRTYSLVALFSALSVWLYWRVSHAGRKPGILTQAAFVASLVGLLYTHYAAALVAIAIALYHFLPAIRLYWRRPKLPASPSALSTQHFSLLLFLAALCFLPWLRVILLSFAEVADPDEMRQQMDAWGALQALAYGYGNGLLPLLLVVGGSALAMLRVSRKPGVRYLGFVAVVTLVLSLLLNATLPYITHIRYLIALLPLWAVLFGVGVEGLRRIRVSPVAVYALWIALGLWGSFLPVFTDNVIYGVRHETFFRPRLPLHTVAREIAAQAQVDDRVLLASPMHQWAIAGAFDYYMHPLPVRYTMADQLPGKEAGDEYYRQAQAFVGDALRVWLAVERSAPPDFRLAEFERVLLDGGFTPCSQGVELPGISLALYSRLQACCCPPESLDGLPRFGNGIVLTYVEPLPETANAALPVTMAWSAAADVPRATYSVALHVMDAAGQLVAQSDASLPDEPFACRARTVNISALPPGSYAVYAVVYNWQTGERLPVTAAEGGDGDRLLLGRFALR